MIRINLLPVKQAKKRGAGQQQLLLFAVVLIALGIGLYVMYSKEVEEVDRLQAQQADIQKELKRMEELIGDINTSQQKKADLEKKLAVIDTLRRGKTGPVRILDELSTVIPKKVWLLTLDDKGNSLSMEGYAIDNKEIAIFMKNLENSRFFSNVALVSITQSTGKSFPIPVMNFKLTCKYTVPQS